MVKVGKMQGIQGKRLDPQADGQHGLNIQDQIEGWNESYHKLYLKSVKWDSVSV